MKAILAADENWGIGYQNGLLISIPSDMRFFQKKTMGHIVIMGRKTLESLPGKKPLQGRTNLVLSRSPFYQVEGAEVFSDLDGLFDRLKKERSRPAFVIGGEQIYRLLLPYCEAAYVTKIRYSYQADAFFPNLDKDPEWELQRESEEQTYFDIEYTFRKYVRKTIA